MTMNTLEAAIADLRKAVAANAPRDQFAIGTVIRWTARERFTYAAIKTSIGWFTTARPGNPYIKNFLAYEELEEILARPETADAAVATAWEFLDGQGERPIDVQEEPRPYNSGLFRNPASDDEPSYYSTSGQGLYREDYPGLSGESI